MKEIFLTEKEMVFLVLLYFYDYNDFFKFIFIYLFLYSFNYIDLFICLFVLVITFGFSLEAFTNHATVLSSYILLIFITVNS